MQSVELAKCPLCRSPLLKGIQGSLTGDVQDGGNALVGDSNAVNGNNSNIPAGGEIGDDQQLQQAPPNNPQPNDPEERALFRFSTEGILPAWLPIPAVSFEVVRRDNQAVAQNPETGGLQGFLRRGGEAANNNNANNGPGDRIQDDQPQQSFWRRVLIMIGVMPMSPEEEAMSIEQLVGEI